MKDCIFGLLAVCGGGSVSFERREHEMTDEEAAKAQRAAREAYEMIIASQKRAEAAERI